MRPFQKLALISDREVQFLATYSILQQITTLVPEDLTPSFGLFQYLAQVLLHRHTCRQNTHTHARTNKQIHGFGEGHAGALHLRQSCYRALDPCSCFPNAGPQACFPLDSIALHFTPCCWQTYLFPVIPEHHLNQKLAVLTILFVDCLCLRQVSLCSSDLLGTLETSVHHPHHLHPTPISVSRQSGIRGSMCFHTCLIPIFYLYPQVTKPMIQSPKFPFLICLSS